MLKSQHIAMQTATESIVRLAGFHPAVSRSAVSHSGSGRSIFIRLACAIVFACAASLAPCVGHAQVGDISQSAEDMRPTLPPYPVEANLIKLPVDGATNFEFFVDLTSVVVDPSGVIRYTLVSRSGTATNVAYEGLRCKERDRKSYAFGRNDATWFPTRSPKWQPIADLPTNRAQAFLHVSVFCPMMIMVRDAEEAKKNLKAGGASDPTGQTR